MARQRNAIFAVLLAATGVAWAVVVSQAGDSGHEAARMPGMAGGAQDAAASLDLTMGMGPAAYLGMWVAMMAAMMFPAAAPMILSFARMEQGKRRRGRPYVPTFVFASSYLALWAAFGLAAFGVSTAVERLAAAFPAMVDAWGAVTGGVLVLAGAYQLSPLKDRCLTACRTPVGFLLTSWAPGRRGAVRMGLRHGVYCVGCCWLLFAVLVVLGVMSVAAMIVVALVVFSEKTLPGGVLLARLAAVALIAVGAVALVDPAVLPSPVV